MKLFFLVAALAAAWAQTRDTFPRTITVGPVAGLPSTVPANSIAFVSDGLNSTDCTSGGGSSRVLCVYTGSAWSALGGGGGATWVSTASYHWMSYRMSGGTVGPNGNSADTVMTFATIQGNTANSYSAQGTIRIYHPQSSNTYKSFGGLIYGAGAYPPSTNTIWIHNFFGNYNSTTPINGFQIIPGSGNLASGIVRLYGLKKS